MTQIPDIIGLPPSGHVSDNFMESSLPVAEFIPGEPNFQKGLTLFRIKESINKYNRILGNHGFSSKMPLKLAFLADNFPTDSFSNQYGSHFLDQITGVVSESAQGLAQTFGGRTATQALENISKGVQGEESGKMFNMLGKGLGAGVSQLRGLKSSLKDQGFGGAAETIDKVLAGARVDFPQIWQGSGFEPSYTMTVRLYNPDPASEAATNKYIVGPIAAILTLALPQSEDEGTYQWPFFLKIKSRGLYRLDPAVISNISIIKGGDQQQISFNQRLGIVDVRIDMTGLFKTMLLETSDPNPDSGRPTLSQYLDNMKDMRNIPNIYDPTGYTNTGFVASAENLQENLVEGGTGKESTPTEIASAESRVNDKDKSAYDKLKNA